MGNRYLYLRTRLPLAHSEPAIMQLAELWDYGPQTLRMGSDRPPWADGTVVRFSSSQTPGQVMAWMRKHLSGFDAWGCHDGLNRAVENPAGGPLTTFFQGLGSLSLHQLCLQMHPDNQRAEAAVAKLRLELDLKKGRSRPVMNFRNGQVLLIATKEPSSILFRRCEAALRDKVPFRLIDTRGICYDIGGEVRDEDCWLDLVGDEWASGSGAA